MFHNYFFKIKDLLTILQEQNAVARSQVCRCGSKLSCNKLCSLWLHLFNYIIQFTILQGQNAVARSQVWFQTFMQQIMQLMATPFDLYHSTYHTTRAECCGEITGVVDHSQEYVGSRYQGYLVPSAVLSVYKVCQNSF